MNPADILLIALVISIWIISGLIFALRILGGEEELSEEDLKLRRQVIRCVIAIFVAGIVVTIILVMVFNIRFPRVP